MGLFSKLLKNDDSPNGKSKKWFFSEEGRLSFEKYMASYDSVETFLSKMDSNEMMYSIQGACGEQVVVNGNYYPPVNQGVAHFTDWPYIYFYQYLTALVKEGDIKENENGRLKMVAAIDDILLDIFGLVNKYKTERIAYFSIFYSVVEVANKLSNQWPRPIEESSNVIVALTKKLLLLDWWYSVIHSDCPSCDDKLQRIRIPLAIYQYVKDVFINHGENALDTDSWIFDKSFYTNGTESKTIQEIEQSMQGIAKYKDCVPSV